MRHNKYCNCLRLLCTVLVTVFMTAGCTKENISGCYKPTFLLQIKAYDADGEELSKETVKDVILYIFDNNKAFIASREVDLFEHVTLDYPDYENLIVVAWGNGQQGHQTMPSLEKGDHLETAFVSLIQSRKISLLPEAGSPDDLFYGVVNITKTKNQSGEVLSIRRKTSSVAITARYLKEAFVANDEEFHYSLRKSTDKLDFYGKPNGTYVSYRPDARFNTKGDFESSIFNIFSSNEDIMIDIFHQNVLKTTITTDSEGKPLKAVEGQLLNIFINFESNVSIEVKVTEWGKKEIWKEFQ